MSEEKANTNATGTNTTNKVPTIPKPESGIIDDAVDAAEARKAIYDAEARKAAPGDKAKKVPRSDEARKTSLDDEAPRPPHLTEDSTPEEREEYFLSNFSYILFSKPLIDRMIEEIRMSEKRGVSESAIDEAVELAKSLQKFDYTGCASIDMPDIAMDDDKTNKKYIGVSMRFQLQLLPREYDLSFSVPKQYHSAAQKSVGFLQLGSVEFAKHFLAANNTTMNEIREKTGLRLDRLHFDDKTVGLYFDVPDGNQIQVKYDFYAIDENSCKDISDAEGDDEDAAEGVTEDN